MYNIRILNIVRHNVDEPGIKLVSITVLFPASSGAGTKVIGGVRTMVSHTLTAPVREELKPVFQKISI